MNEHLPSNFMPAAKVATDFGWQPHSLIMMATDDVPSLSASCPLEMRWLGGCRSHLAPLARPPPRRWRLAQPSARCWGHFSPPIASHLAYISNP